MDELNFDSAGNLIPEGYEVLQNPDDHVITNINPDTQLGSPVTVFGMDGYIRAVILTISKVRFSIRLIPQNTTIHNIDSIYVVPRAGDRLDMGSDNYS